MNDTHRWASMHVEFGSCQKCMTMMDALGHAFIIIETANLVTRYRERIRSKQRVIRLAKKDIKESKVALKTLLNSDIYFTRDKWLY